VETILLIQAAAREPSEDMVIGYLIEVDSWRRVAESIRAWLG
jgi:hypothetical protein